MGKQGLKYVLLCMAIYLVLSAIEIFAFKPLIDLITVSFINHVIIYNAFLLLINPLVAYLLINKYFKFEENND